MKLSITADANRKWIAVVDPLPAGFEAMNAKLATGADVSSRAPATWQQRQNHWSGVTWDHEEMRDDRVLWFADNMPSGSYEVEYQARATIDGTFTAMTATVEAMYAPEQRARTTKATFTITK